jgi:hypothetical protein
VTTVAGRSTTLGGSAIRLAEGVVRWLQTGLRDPDLFGDDLFVDLSLPHWRLQGEGADAAFRLREHSHPYPGTVTVGLLEPTPRGFVMAFEERWDAEGQRWYSREMMHCTVRDDRIRELGIYCTGDWDEQLQRRHRDQVRLARP